MSNYRTIKKILKTAKDNQKNPKVPVVPLYRPGKGPEYDDELYLGLWAVFFYKKLKKRFKYSPKQFRQWLKK